jgi:hypothetical protein
MYFIPVQMGMCIYGVAHIQGHERLPFLLVLAGNKLVMR